VPLKNKNFRKRSETVIIYLMTPLFQMSSLWVLLDVIISTKYSRQPIILIYAFWYQHHTSTAIANSLSYGQLLESPW